MEHEIVKAAHRAVAENWGVPAATPESVDDAHAWLLDELEARIHELLKRNPRKLLAAMYILDVSETRYNAAMALLPAERARALAVIVLERETEKIRVRARYAARPGGYILPEIREETSIQDADRASESDRRNPGA